MHVLECIWVPYIGCLRPLVTPIAPLKIALNSPFNYYYAADIGTTLFVAPLKEKASEPPSELEQESRDESVRCESVTSRARALRSFCLGGADALASSPLSLHGCLRPLRI